MPDIGPTYPYLTDLCEGTGPASLAFLKQGVRVLISFLPEKSLKKLWQLYQLLVGTVDLVGTGEHPEEEKDEKEENKSELPQVANPSTEDVKVAAVTLDAAVGFSFAHDDSKKALLALIEDHWHRKEPVSVAAVEQKFSANSDAFVRLLNADPDDAKPAAAAAPPTSFGSDAKGQGGKGGKKAMLTYTCTALVTAAGHRVRRQPNVTSDQVGW